MLNDSFDPGSKLTLANFFPVLLVVWFVYNYIVFVLNFLIQSHVKRGLFIRIFRVLHTVQSSIIKVRFVAFSFQQQLDNHIILF